MWRPVVAGKAGSDMTTIGTMLSGLGVSLGLIMVIGAQNAFVLRQGLRREHVLASVLFCAVSDAALIALGIAGMSGVIGAMPGLMEVLRWAGVAFLVVYALRSVRAAWRGNAAMFAGTAGRASLGATLATLFMFTWANPHVWIDTVLLIGSIAAQYPGHRLAFGIGAAAGSALFFSTLGFGARLLAPLFARPRAWVVLDLIVAALLLWTAWRLALH